jgi:hypothetical protein
MHLIDVNPSPTFYPLLCVDNAPEKIWEITTRKNQNPTFIPSEQKPKVGKMKYGINVPKDHNYAHMHIVQPSTINHDQQSTINIQQVWKMVGVCTNTLNFKEPLQILIENSQSQFVEYKY